MSPYNEKFVSLKNSLISISYQNCAYEIQHFKNCVTHFDIRFE